MRDTIEVIKTILKEKNYLKKIIFSFIIMLIASAFLMTFISLPGLLQGELLFAPEITLRNALFLVTFSFLVSLAVVLNVYKYNEMKKFSIGKEGVGFFGFFFGLFTSACAVCYPLILTALGIPTIMLLLPFGGIEFQVLSIVFLVLSVYLVIRSIIKGNLCRIKK